MKVKSQVLIAVLFLSVLLMGGDTCKGETGSGVLSLEQCLTLALDSSPDLAGARQNILVAKASLLGAYGSFMPTFRMNTGYSHAFEGPKPASQRYDATTQSFFKLDPVASHDYEYYNFGLNGNLTIFSGFSRWADMSAQRSNLAATNSDLETARDNVEGEVIRLYYELVNAQMMVELKQRNLGAVAKQHEQSCRAFAMGAVARSDTLRTSVRHAEVKLELLQAINNSELGQVALATTLGLAPTTDLRAEIPGEPLFVEIDRPLTVSAALQNNPALHAADHRLAAAGQTVKQAKSGRWPSVSASYNYNWGDLKSPDGLMDVFEDDYGYSLGLNFSWNLFDGFSTKSNINRARANTRVQEYSLEQQRRNLIRSVVSTVVNLNNSRKRIELATITIELAREDLRLAQERYRVGAATLLDITDAEVSLASANTNRIDGITGYLSSLAELKRMTGLVF